MNNIIKQLNWRYAVKKYDANKKIPNETLTILKETVRLSPSSRGLQAFQIMEIDSKEMREKLAQASGNPSQILDSSNLFVFCAKTAVEHEYVDLIVETIASNRQQKIEDLNGYKFSVLNHVSQLSKEELTEWNSKQCYIALGFLLESAALMEIDATPIEGFNKEGFNSILNLDEKHLTSVVVCALGYRSSEDHYQHLSKTRKSIAHFFEKV
jgi:nitroreductase